jgi:hypothetical protein
MNTKIKSTAIAVAVAGLFAAQPALADTLDWSGGFFFGSPTTSYINSISPAVNNENVYAGAFTMTNATAGGSSFAAWCASINAPMQNSAAYTLTSATTFYSGDTGKATALSELASNSLASVNNATSSAAFQLAVWEIVNETSGHGYSLTAGNFTANPADGAVLTAANGMLGNLSGPISMTANVWAANTPGSTQDLVVFAPVPEPETYAMMLAGLGLMGFVTRRRKQIQELA